MARARKKETMNPEERLQAALVPDWEQPYKVPENWCWMYFKAISKIRTGKKDANYGSEDGKYPFFTCAAEPIRCHGYSFDCNAILLAGNGDINNISRYNGKFEAYQRTYVVETVEPINIDYVFYWFKYRWFDFNKDKMFGTAIPYIRLGNLQEFPIPVPPLVEQQRIVGRIESLFTKLDEAKQGVQDALDSVETRKAAILHRAFTGELTVRWRKEHGVGMDSWKRVCFDESFEKMQNGLAKRSGNSGSPYVVIRLANLSETGILTGDLRTISLDEEEKINYCLKKNDVLMIRVNGSKENVGKQYLVEGDNQWAFCDHIIRIRYKEAFSPAYMVYLSKSNDYRLYVKDNMVSSAGQNTISRKGLSALPVPLPTKKEQTEIVRILDDLFAKEQQAKKAAEAVLEQIDLIKKSILARAFRGKLGTNDPAEESALELIRQALEKDDQNVINYVLQMQ